MVALSLSSVIRGSSALTLAPAWTCTSITGTSLKSPISGTLISIAIVPALLEHEPAHVLEDVAQVAGEASGKRAVDDAVVVGDVERLHQPGLKLLAVPDRGHLGAHHAQDRPLGRVDDRGEVGAADAAQRRDGEGAALHVAGRQPAVAGLLRDRTQLPAQLLNAF